MSIQTSATWRILLYRHNLMHSNVTVDRSISKIRKISRLIKYGREFGTWIWKMTNNFKPLNVESAMWMILTNVVNALTVNTCFLISWNKTIISSYIYATDKNTVRLVLLKPPSNIFLSISYEFLPAFSWSLYLVHHQNYW